MKRIKERYNPQKITYQGKCNIIDTDNQRLVIKSHTNDLEDLSSYLSSRGFNSYPKIIDKYDDKYVYEYLSDSNEPINQKANDLALTISDLHNKTSHNIKIVKNDIDNVYSSLNDNINYISNYYARLFKEIISEEYPSPSHYLLIRNQSTILNLIKYLKEELKTWNHEILNSEEIRVVYCHNNLSINHYLNHKLISWDKYRIDTPILDIINLYHNDYNKYDFSSFLKTYITNMDLTPNEERLLFISISIPEVIYFTDDEMENTIKVSRLIDYINNTEKLIRPYYPIKQKE